MKRTIVDGFLNDPREGRMNPHQSTPPGKGALLALALAAMVLTGDVVSGAPPAQRGPAQVTTPSMEADPVLLLARIQDLERRLAKAEKTITAADGELQKLKTHTHKYSYSVPGINGFYPLKWVLNNPNPDEWSVAMQAKGQKGGIVESSTKQPDY